MNSNDVSLYDSICVSKDLFYDERNWYINFGVKYSIKYVLLAFSEASKTVCWNKEQHMITFCP